MCDLTNDEIAQVISGNSEHIVELKSRISRLEKFVILAIITNLPQLMKIFQI